jgi:hypothetical protein
MTVSARGAQIRERSVDTNALADQFCLHDSDIDIGQCPPLLNRDRRCDTGTLPADGATHHVTNSGMADFVAADAPPGDK